MTRATSNLNASHRLLAVAWLLSVALQCGACPCGCLEHNAWMQLTEWLAGEPHPPHDSDDRVLPAVEGHHDCTGDSHTQYLNNAPAVRAVAARGELPVVVRVTPPANVLACAAALRHAVDERFRPVAHALTRPAVQVYRL